MRNIITYDLFENEGSEISQSLFRQMQQRYNVFERGLIRAWGGVLYLGYHNLPEEGPVVRREDYERELSHYATLDEEDPEFEDMYDWFSDAPPRMGGRALFNKRILREDFRRMAEKTLTPFDMVIYRTSEIEEPGLNSYTIKKGAYSNPQLKERAYLIPAGTPLVFASDIADDGEIIWDPTQEELAEYSI